MTAPARALAVLPAPARSAARAVPVPDCEPPLRHRLAAGNAEHPAALALLEPAPAPALSRPRRPQLHLVPPAPSARAGARHADLRPVARQLAGAVVEVLAGTRSPRQLAGRVSTPVATAIEAARRSAGPASRSTTAAAVRSVRVQRNDATTAEVCAVVRRGERYSALAMKLQLVNGQWMAVRLHAGR